MPKSNKVSFNARHDKLSVREQKPKKKKARRKGFIPRQPGDPVQMDTVSIFACATKRYLFTAIDISTRFTFAYAYKSNSSTNGSDFLDKLTKVAPFAIKRVQADNGSEFLKHFEQAYEEKDLMHFFNYPKHPQANGYLERFNRTIQEQFVNQYIDTIDEVGSAGFEPATNRL